MLSLRARAAARPLYSRFLASTTRLRADGDAPRPPQPPKPIDDSTSALDYKQSQRTRPPPLPTMDLPRSRSAEEAVTNILYNTPPPSLQPFKKSVSPVGLLVTALSFPQACPQLSRSKRARSTLPRLRNPGRARVQH